MAWIDSDFPLLLGMELYRPTPSYIAEMVFEPLVVWDFSKAPGETVQLDRYKFWANPGTKESRRRTATQTIGTASSRSLTKEKVLVTLDEYTGPADPSDPSQPSTFQIPMQSLIKAQRSLYQIGVQGFHESIGSLNLLDDYRRWRDRVWINEALKSPHTYNPGGVADQGAYGVGSNANVEGRFDITNDLMTIVEEMRSNPRLAPTYEDGNYRCLASPRFMKHLRSDPDFREVARYPGFQGFQPSMGIYGGPQYMQSNTPMGMPVMPSGFVYEGVRFFESANMPSETVDIAFNAAAWTDETAEAQLGIFCSPHSLGIAMGGNQAQVLLNNNDDFQRFIIAIWCLYAGFEPLNLEFITVARTFGN